MISIVNEFNETIVKCETYFEVCRILHQIENHKLLNDEDGSNFRKSWGFCIHNQRSLKILHDNLYKVPPLLKKAYEEEIGLLEIWKGDPFNIEQILLTPHVDWIKITKEWCLDYCQAHRFRIDLTYDENKASRNL